MKGFSLILLLFTAITGSAFAQGNAHARETMIVHLRPTADMKVVKANSNTSLQLNANKSMMLNVNSEKNPSEALTIKAAEGKNIPVNSNPSDLLSGNLHNSLSNMMAINYSSIEATRNGSVNVVFTLTDR